VEDGVRCGGDRVATRKESAPPVRSSLVYANLASNIYFCQTGKKLKCLAFYLDGEMYALLYPSDARHPDPPQSHL
jgi:hypothetical protein